MYQVIIKDRFACSVHIAQFFFEDREDAEEFQEYVEENHINYQPDIIDIETFSIETAIDIASDTLRKRHE